MSGGPFDVIPGEIYKENIIKGKNHENIGLSRIADSK